MGRHDIYDTRSNIGATPPLYIIETRNDHLGASGQVPWASDTIGDNPPRPRGECEDDIAAFIRGDCGPDFSESFSDPENYRIVEVPEEPLAVLPEEVA